MFFPGEAGKEVGFIRNGEFHKISTVLNATTVNEADAELKALGKQEGKQDVGNDLVIWTKHFTTFVAYQETQAGSSGSGDGGGGGGGGPAVPARLPRSLAKRAEACPDAMQPSLFLPMR